MTTLAAGERDTLAQHGYLVVRGAFPHLWHADMASTARSRRDPRQVATWERVETVWRHNHQRQEHAW